METINAAASAMVTSAHVQQSSDIEEAAEATTTTTDNADKARQEEEEQLWTFDPAKGNVVFASALYGWGFTVPSLSRSLFRQCPDHHKRA